MMHSHGSNVCAALAAAEDVARLEAETGAVERQMNAAPHTSRNLGRLQDQCDALLLEAEDARERLAAADATSVSGAVAQLLAAIRDIRVRDDVEAKRARTLEAKAMRFLGGAEVLDACLALRVSQTRYPALGVLQDSAPAVAW